MLTRLAREEDWVIELVSHMGYIGTVYLPRVFVVIGGKATSSVVAYCHHKNPKMKVFFSPNYAEVFGNFRRECLDLF